MASQKRLPRDLRKSLEDSKSYNVNGPLSREEREEYPVLIGFHL